MIDFFEAQERARKRTALLVALFAAAVIGIIVVVYIAAHFALTPGSRALEPMLLIQVVIGVALVVGVGSAYRTASLSKGGPAVAELLGGRRLAPDATDLAERRFLNIVEEMAIAAGTPVPAVYILDGEDGINAFAAGYSTHDAAVAVTRGALRQLSRDELQGVVAHEFSHILNGDMRLNIRLIGLVYGILLLAIVGRGILRVGPRGGGRRDRNGGGVAMLGLALFIAGYIGVFFGKLIKSAVSRQREYLADSAAVEFTRNPDGLAGALRKIGGASLGSRIADPHAEELSHLFFANGMGRSLSAMFSTHPPLDDRIRRLDPAWSGQFDPPDPGAPYYSDGDGYAPAHPEPLVAGLAPGSPGSPGETRATGDGGTMIESVGAPSPADLEHARAFLRALPSGLLEAAHSERGAIALVFALALQDAVGEGSAAVERELVRGFGGAELAERVDRLHPLIRAQGDEGRLPLLDVALPALQGIAPGEAERLLQAVEKIIIADGRVRLFEYAMRHTLRRWLLGPDRSERSGSMITSFAPLKRETEVLLSALAWTGSGWREDAAREALRAGAALLPTDAGDPRLIDLTDVSIDGIDEALDRFQHASPAVKKRLLEACVEIATADSEVDASEIELVRAIAESLDCPMPFLSLSRSRA